MTNVQSARRMIREAEKHATVDLITDPDEIRERSHDHTPGRSVIGVYPQARVLRYKDLFSLFHRHRPILPMIMAVKDGTGAQVHRVYIFAATHSNRYPGHYFLLSGLDPEENHLFVSMQLDNEPVRARLDGKVFERVYFFPRKLWKPMSRPSEHPQVVSPRPLPAYDLVVPEQTGAGTAKNVLVLCAIHRYVKKKTSAMIRKLFPGSRVHVTNTGEEGSHHFLLDQYSALTWPDDIPQTFDLMVFEYCPIAILTPVHLRFLVSKLSVDGFVLFLSIYDTLLTRQEFENLIALLETSGMRFYDYIMSQQTPTPECKKRTRNQCQEKEGCLWIEKSEQAGICGKKKIHP